MLVDIVSFGETMLRFSPSVGSRLESTHTLQSYVAGSETNTLACLARLGLQTVWLSALPQNPLGKRVETELRGHGVDTRVVWVENARLGTFYAEELPAPLGTQVYYDRANSACALLDPDALDLSALDTARFLHLTGITPALSAQSREICARLLARARAKRIPLAFDVNYRARLCSPEQAAANIEEACQQAQILLCTRADAAELWNIKGEPEAILRALAERFTAHGEPKTLVLTLSESGSAHLVNGAYHTEPVRPTEGKVRFGSGDAFAAGYLYATLHGPLFVELEREQGITPLAFGNTFAALKRCIAGDIALITPTDISTLFQQGTQRFR